jgi:G3E family GTPase
MKDRIPVTIITGFWGAGKTTLLNSIISNYKNKKFAIIENEFGDIGIDGGLIVGADENIFELANGCICCSLNDDFYETLYKLLDGAYEFNHLLIETTGIADPDTIIQAFISSEKIQMHFMLDSVVALADAINLEDIIDEQPEFASN